uniref:Magnesium transporter n=1 Tax=Hemiselmis tepida TaxID=464990 RepID=A0A7S0YZY4_9CRYP
MATRMIVAQRSPNKIDSPHGSRNHLDREVGEGDSDNDGSMQMGGGGRGKARPKLQRHDTVSDIGVLADAEGVVNMKMLLEAKGMGTTPTMRPPADRFHPVEKWVFSKDSAVMSTLEPNRMDKEVNSLKSFHKRSSVDVEPAAAGHASPPAGAASGKEEGRQVTWYHVFGRDLPLLTSICDTLGARAADVQVADEGKGSDGIQVEFRRGETREKDYLFIVFQEILLKRAVSAIRNDNVVPPSPTHNANGGAHDVPVTTRRPIDPLKGDHRRTQREGKGKKAAALKRRDEIWAASKQLELEASQVAFFYFPDRQVIVSTGLSSVESPAIVAARENIENLRSAVRTDCGKGDGAATLLVVLLDGVMDAIFPVLDLYGDALEGLTNLMASAPHEMFVRLSARLKTRLNQIRRFNWDARGVFLQMHQDMYGVFNGSSRVQTLIDSTLQVEKEADAYIVKCSGLQQMYADFQQMKINSTLNALTNLTFALMPFSALTGLWGMNFEGMPELSYEWGYAMFWCIAGLIQALVWIYICREMLWASKFARQMRVRTLGALE